MFDEATRAARDGKREVWRDFACYTPTAGASANAHGRRVFLRDGRVETWFELLDLWFDDARADPGGFVGYRPRASLRCSSR